MDETTWYYKATPRTSVVLKKAPALKQDKSRVTMIVGANADGTDKLPLVFLGKAMNSRWLTEKPADVQYIGTTKGWMTVGVHQAWLRDLDERMAKEDRKILLLVDNAPVHIHRGMNLCNVSILKLSPNTTPLFQPMDQGVIAFLKHAYMNLKDDAAVDTFLEGDTSPY